MTGFVKKYPSVQSADAALWRSRVARQAGVRTPAVLEAVGKPGLADMQQVLVPLNRMPQESLTRFDPFLRIRPRLDRAPQQVQDIVHRLVAQDAALQWAGTAVIHGDFHPGQVICDSQGQPWLVDLDDLALAPPEADLGNLVAWMTTQYPPLLPLVLPKQADPDLTAHFRAIALVRRALKLAEKGQLWALDQLSLRA
jgi:aminoglycoside phosphotransferase (APT) family kinase protein